MTNDLFILVDESQLSNGIKYTAAIFYSNDWRDVSNASPSKLYSNFDFGSEKHLLSAEFQWKWDNSQKLIY